MGAVYSSCCFQLIILAVGVVRAVECGMHDQCPRVAIETGAHAPRPFLNHALHAARAVACKSCSGTNCWQFILRPVAPS
ncbi:hypothetical protein C8Q78DRAFT_126610 [Trametes maxima]|nr:hypothetical protein C8Q78DRAFT_126610 [Trametes maxima]